MSTYSVGQVEALMPAVWDSSVVLNRRNPLAPEPEMPKAQGDPRSTINKTCECADVQVAWVLTDLTTRERQVLLLRFAFDELVDDIADTLGIAQSATSRALDSGLTKMAEYLGARPLG